VKRDWWLISVVLASQSEIKTKEKKTTANNAVDKRKR
jgi:hypothetical protein